MQNKYLGLLGLAKRAGKLEAGDEATRAAITAKSARLVLIASDASDRTRDNFLFITESENVACLMVAETRAELGNALGRRPSAVVGICDAGLAAATAKAIAETDESASEISDALNARAAKISARRNKGKKKK